MQIFKNVLSLVSSFKIIYAALGAMLDAREGVVRVPAIFSFAPFPALGRYAFDAVAQIRLVADRLGFKVCPRRFTFFSFCSVLAAFIIRTAAREGVVPVAVASAVSARFSILKMGKNVVLPVVARARNAEFRVAFVFYAAARFAPFKVFRLL